MWGSYQAKVDTHEDEREEINGTNEAQEILVFSQDLVDGGEPRGDDGQGPVQGGQWRHWKAAKEVY